MCSRDVGVSWMIVIVLNLTMLLLSWSLAFFGVLCLPIGHLDLSGGVHMGFRIFIDLCDPDGNRLVSLDGRYGSKMIMFYTVLSTKVSAVTDISWADLSAG